MFLKSITKRAASCLFLFFYCPDEGFNLEPISCFSRTLTLVLLQVSERDDKLLAEHMAKLKSANEEVDGDEGSEEEEDTGMGEVDLDNSGIGITD